MLFDNVLRRIALDLCVFVALMAPTGLSAPPGGVALLRAVKRALDPEDLLNPGVLIPDA